ncbi:MAG: hypothetical protein ACRCYE_14970 [Sarcina sp.]
MNFEHKELVSLDEALNYFENAYKNIQTKQDLKKYNNELNEFINGNIEIIEKLRSKIWGIVVVKVNYKQYTLTFQSNDFHHLEKLSYLEQNGNRTIWIPVTSIQIFKLEKLCDYLVEAKKSSLIIPFKVKGLSLYLIIFIIVIFLMR